jgi:hypothetical protein
MMTRKKIFSIVLSGVAVGVIGAVCVNHRYLEVLFFLLPLLGLAVFLQALIQTICAADALTAQRNVFCTVAIIMLFLFLFGTSETGEGRIFHPYQNFVAAFGIVFNAVFALFLRQWMVKPFICIFSESVHKKITSTIVLLNGFFFVVFTCLANVWYLYIKYDHPMVAKFFQSIFT